MKYLFILLMFLLTLSPAFSGEKKEIIIATTTSICDTGLLDTLGEVFYKKTGYVIKPVAVGTGEALLMGSKGEADLVIVHNEKAETEFIKNGYGLKREKIMHNFFVLLGPSKDPGEIKKSSSVFDAFKKIEKGQYTFLSRGDDSGTNKKELDIWNKAGIKPQGKWYMESGQGMSQTLFIANEKQAYTLTDMGTFLFLKDKIFDKSHDLGWVGGDVMGAHLAGAVKCAWFESVKGVCCLSVLTQVEQKHYVNYGSADLDVATEAYIQQSEAKDREFLAGR